MIPVRLCLEEVGDLLNDRLRLESLFDFSTGGDFWVSEFKGQISTWITVSVLLQGRGGPSVRRSCGLVNVRDHGVDDVTSRRSLESVDYVTLLWEMRVRWSLRRGWGSLGFRDNWVHRREGPWLVYTTVPRVL